MSIFLKGSKVKVHYTCALILIVTVQELIIVSNIKWYGINICINRDKSASGFIINNKVVFNKLQKIRSN